jgi:hypothetical protein
VRDSCRKVVVECRKHGSVLLFFGGIFLFLFVAAAAHRRGNSSLS